MGRKSSEKQKRQRGRAETRGKKAQVRAIKSLATMKGATAFEPQVIEDSDDMNWAFIGGVQRPKK